MSTPLQETGSLFRFVHDLAEEAGQLVAAGAFRSHASLSKSSANDLVTEYDRRSEAYLLARLASRFPDDLLVAEESSEGRIPEARPGQRRWLIDPLDGTTNFSHGLPFFCVSIAVEEGGVVLAGAVDAPALGWRFVAERDKGAWLWRTTGTPLRLAVSRTETLARSLLATGFPYDRATSPQNNFDEFIALQKQSQAVRRIGAAALDLALVASGQFDGYWEMKLKPWDLAAGVLLVEEAGGKVTGYQGEPVSLIAGKVVASNGLIHTPLVAAVAQAANSLNLGAPRG